MALILNIETATSVCSVSLTNENGILAIRESSEVNSHARVVAVFIDEILKETGVDKRQLDAVAVSKGPGSYTGLRIGVSTAKGLCYALDKPLIGISTLESMACGMKQKSKELSFQLPVLYVPMIDARRMEVYTAVFDEQLQVVCETAASVITGDSFNDLLAGYHLIIAGDGADKCREVLHHPNITFQDNFTVSSAYMNQIAQRQFHSGAFEDVAYFEPFYLKDFIAGKPKVKGLI